MASSSASSSVQQKYQVFLSFRGEDTRNNFTSFLHEALKKKGIDTFIDDRLERGEEISPSLMTAIEESKISIIILSKNYASSSFCLDELSKILECKDRNEQKVVPIFYYVDPSDLRKLSGTFAEAIDKHVKKWPDKVERWSAALKKIGALSGHHLDAKKDGRESIIVEQIAKEISKDLMHKSSYDTKGLVGIDSCIRRIKSLLRINSADVRIIGIYGMGGIGKTTIGEVVYYQFFDEFESCCFLNVKDELNRGGEVDFLKKLLSKVLEDKNLNIDTSLLPAPIFDRLRQKKVFIVLDDVNNLKKLDILRKKHYFGSGSRIIIISREKQVLGHIVDEIHEVDGLIDEDALQLFSEYAFKQSCPIKDFMELSKKVVDYAKGLPLALKVMGSFLNDKKSKSDWEVYLSRLKEIIDPKIDVVLRVSYDGLIDDEERNIFFDIASLFKRGDKDYFTKILGGCYHFVFEINVLIDKSLITNSDNKLKRYDLLQQMAWKIVRQESKRPDKRSRLWTPKNIYYVLKNNKDAERVEGIFLDMSNVRELCLSSTAFAEMCNLERERRVYLPQHGLESLLDNLHYLHLDDYPSKSLASNFCQGNLINLKLRDSHVKLSQETQVRGSRSLDEPTKKEPWGGHGGSYWSFKAEGGITEILIMHGGAIHCISFKSDNGSGKVEYSKKFGSETGRTDKILFDWPTEFLTSISGTYNQFFANSEAVVITSLCFYTNRTKYGPFGSENGSPFSFLIDDGVIFGFHGRSGQLVDAIGVYVKPNLTYCSTSQESVMNQEARGSNSLDEPTKKGPWGGHGGSYWSFKAEGGITEILIMHGGAIDCISFKSDNGSGKVKYSKKFGSETGRTDKILFDWPTEFLTSISGTYNQFFANSEAVVITSLCFYTNRTKYGPFGSENGSSFSFLIDDGVIFGFHGRSGQLVDAIGVYVKPNLTYCSTSQESVMNQEAGGSRSLDEPTKEGPWGGHGGSFWSFKAEGGITEILIRHGWAIHCISFKSDNGSGEVEYSHNFGGKGGSTSKILFDWPREFLTSISGTHERVHFISPAGVVITSLCFYTNRTKYGPFGLETGSRFSYSINEGVIFGFHGHADLLVDSIGVYVKPNPTYCLISQESVMNQEVNNVMNVDVPRAPGP